MDDARDSCGFSVEYINSLNPNGLPRHCIELKKGVPVMLLRNLQPKQGLCNGTRLIFQSLSNNCRVLMCSYKYNRITKETAIPRIVLKPKTNEFPFDWSRRQFPLRVAFACTINKSQGQTMKRIGLWLPSPVFGLGYNVGQQTTGGHGSNSTGRDDMSRTVWRQGQLLAGDMRQCLVVVPGASRAGIVERTVNQCPLWNQFEVMELTRNMRVLTSGDERLIAWDNFITSIGNGTCGTPTVDGNVVSFSEEMCLKIEQNTAEDNNRESKSVAELINKVFPDLKDNMKDPDWLPGRAILTPTNKAVDAINDIVVASIPGAS